MFAKLCLPIVAATAPVQDPPQSYADVIRTGSTAAVVNDSVEKKDALAPLILSTAPPQSRFGTLSQRAALNIGPGGGRGVPSRGVVPPLGNVSSTRQHLSQPQHPSPPAPAIKHTVQPQGSLPQAACARDLSTLLPRNPEHQQQYHHLAHSQQRQLQQAQRQAADLKQTEHQRSSNTRRLQQLARTKAAQRGQPSAGGQSKSPVGSTRAISCEEVFQVPPKQPTAHPPGSMPFHLGDGSMHSIVRPQHTICSKSPMQGNLHLLRRPLPYVKVWPEATDTNPAHGKDKLNVAAEMRANFEKRHDGPAASPQLTSHARPDTRHSTQTRGRQGTIKNVIFTPAEEQPLVSEHPRQLLAPQTLSGGIPQVHGIASSTDAHTRGNKIGVQRNHPNFPTWLPATNQVPNTAATPENVRKSPQGPVHCRTQRIPVTAQGNPHQATLRQPAVGANERPKPCTQINPHIPKPAPYSRESTTDPIPPRQKLPNTKFQSASPCIQPCGRTSVMSSTLPSDGSMVPHTDLRPPQSVRGSVYQAVAQQTPARPQPSIRRVHASQHDPQLAQCSVPPQPLSQESVQPSAVLTVEPRRVRIADGEDRAHQPQQQQNRPPTNTDGLPQNSQPLNGGLPGPLMFPKNPKTNLSAQPGAYARRMPPPARPRGFASTSQPSPLDAFVFPRICRADDVQTQPANWNSSYPRTARIMGKLGSKVLQDLEARPLMRQNQTDRPELFTGNAQFTNSRLQNPPIIPCMKMAGADSRKVTPPSWMGPRQTSDTKTQVPAASAPSVQITQTPHPSSAMSNISSPRLVMTPQPGNAAGQPSPQEHPSSVTGSAKTTPTHGKPVHSTPIGKTSLVNSGQNPSAHSQVTTSGTVALKGPNYVQVPTPSAPCITITPAAIYTHPFEQSYVKAVSAALRSEQCNMTRLNIMADAIAALEKLQSLNSWVVREQRLQQFRLEYIKSLDKFTMLLQPTIEADETANNAREAEMRQREEDAKQREEDAKRPVEERLLNSFSGISMGNLQPVRQGPYWVGPGISPELWQKQEEVFQDTKKQDRKARRKHVGAGQVLGEDEDSVAMFVQQVNEPVHSRLFDPCWGRSNQCKCDAVAGVVEPQPTTDARIGAGTADPNDDVRVQVKGKRKASETLERPGQKRSCNGADLEGGYGKRQNELPPLKKNRGGRPKRKAADTPEGGHPKRVRVSKKKA